jgi:uncharacterized protein (DUF2384 family)
MEKKYLAVSALEGRDELYFISKKIERKFNKLFGQFHDVWQNHEEAVEWLMKNAKFVGYCTCVTK